MTELGLQPSLLNIHPAPVLYKSWPFPFVLYPNPIRSDLAITLGCLLIISEFIFLLTLKLYTPLGSALKKTMLLTVLQLLPH